MFEKVVDVFRKNSADKWMLFEGREFWHLMEFIDGNRNLGVI